MTLTFLFMYIKNEKINLSKLNGIFLFFIVLTVNAQDSCLHCLSVSKCYDYKHGELVTTTCNHVFHLNCITSLLNSVSVQANDIPLMYGCPHCYKLAVPLVRKPEFNFTDVPRYCETEAMNACRLGDIGKLTELLAMNVNIANERLDGIQNISLLQIADKYGNRDCMEALLIAVGDSNIEIINETTAPHMAAGMETSGFAQKTRKIKLLQQSHSTESIFLEKTTQQDINILVSKCMAINCEIFYQRRIVLEKVIKQSYPDDNKFMEIINSGPIYASDCCRFVQDYCNKFNKFYLIEGTAMKNLYSIVSKGCPPMDIYSQESLMDWVYPHHYMVKTDEKATDALSHLKNKFCIIDCTMIYQISYYDAIESLLGKEKFNKIFSRINNPFNVNARVRGFMALREFTTKYPFTKADNSAQKHIPKLSFEKGTVYYFANHKSYLKKHPSGHVGGMNVMLVDIRSEQPCFTGLGFPGYGLISHEIHDIFVNKFNSPAFDDFKMESIYSNLELSKKAEYDRLKYETITLQQLLDDNGGLITGMVKYLDINKIKEYLTKAL